MKSDEEMIESILKKAHEKQNTMKSDSEMIESILKKAHEKQEMMRKTRRLTALGLALITVICAAVAAGFILHKTPSTVIPDSSETPVSDTTEAVPQNAAKGFSLLVASAAQVQPGDQFIKAEHVSGVKLPITGQLVIENVSGMSVEGKSLYHNQLNARFYRDWQASNVLNYIGGAESENYIASLAFQGTFIVFADDTDALQKIEMNCGTFGQLFIMPATWHGKVPAGSKEWFTAVRADQCLTVTAQEYTDVYLNNDVDEANGKTEPIGMFVHYDISDALLKEKELHPEMGYDQITDEITFRAVYKDGSEMSYTVLLTFDESGMLTASMA